MEYANTCIKCSYNNFFAYGDFSLYFIAIKNMAIATCIGTHIQRESSVSSEGFVAVSQYFGK